MSASRYLLFALFLFVFAVSCNSTYSPRPKGYFAINFPEKKYKLFDQPGYPYAFEYPEYATIIKDSTYFEGKPENEWWINVDFPQFNGKIYVSYKEIGSNSFEKLKQDAYRLTYKHTSKAYNIEDSLFTNSNGVYGVFFKVEGNVATAKQFFMTDTAKHFLRGALYFDATPNEDSLGIVYAFLQEDMKHLINSFRWKK